jgi:hypothetical protein
VELLDSLLALNMDPETLHAAESRLSLLPPPSDDRAGGIFSPRLRERGYSGRSSSSNPYPSPPITPSLPSLRPGQIVPPPIDPGVFRAVASIRRLVEEASELAVRARSGLSHTAQSSFASWNTTAAALGFNVFGELGNHSNGRTTTMSPTRIHRLRVLAVQKLAQAYKQDEVAASVMVMQSGTVFDDIAERVLKFGEPLLSSAMCNSGLIAFKTPTTPTRALFIFSMKRSPQGLCFYEYRTMLESNSPTRQLALSTTTQVLDDLIVTQPHTLEYYRTRGVVHCFRDEYSAANRDFTFALKETRAHRKIRFMHHHHMPDGAERKPKRKFKSRKNGRAPESGTSVTANSPDGDDESYETLSPIHPSVGPDAPTPLEAQVLFLRGAAHLSHAAFLIECSVLSLEGVQRVPGGEVRLSHLPQGRYGGVEAGNPSGPLGASDGVKARAYRAVLAEPEFREQIVSLLRKSLRDHERFLALFDFMEESGPPFPGDTAQQIASAHALFETRRPGSSHNATPTSPTVQPTEPVPFTTYHPLLIEAHFGALLCRLLLRDTRALLTTFVRAAAIVGGLEGYPVFLPARSVAQADFFEVLDRLADGWSAGTSLSADVGPLSRREGKQAMRSPSSTSFDGIFPEEDKVTHSSGPSSSSAPQRVLRQNSDAAATPSSTMTMNAAEPREALAGMRMLLAPSVRILRERAQSAATERRLARSNTSPSTQIAPPQPLYIPLHGSRVEIFLAWLGAVHIPEMEVVA